MELEDLKGNIFFEKDNEEGHLSELLYEPILKIFEPQSGEDFSWALAMMLFLLSWDNVIISKKLRIEFFQLLGNLVVYGEENWADNSFSFIQEILITFNPENPFGTKNFIDLKNKKIISWNEVFNEAGIKINFNFY